MAAKKKQNERISNLNSNPNIKVGYNILIAVYFQENPFIKNNKTINSEIFQRNNGFRSERFVQTAEQHFQPTKTHLAEHNIRYNLFIIFFPKMKKNFFNKTHDIGISIKYFFIEFSELFPLPLPL